MKLNKENKGELIIFFEAIIWSFFPIFLVLSYNSLSPLYVAGFSLTISALLFAFILTVKKEWHYFKTKGIWKDIILATFLLSIIFYGLNFIGISKTTAGNASLVLNLEAFFAMAILGPIIKHEKITKNILIGGILTVLGATLIILPGKLSPQIGDLLILIAVIFPPLGNMFTQSVRKKVSSSFIMFSRSAISAPIMLLTAYLLEPVPTFNDINASLIVLLFTGLISLGIRTLIWIEGINLIPISKANSIATIAPAFTLIFSYFILKEVPTTWQIAGFIPMLIGLQILIKKPKTPAKN